MDGDLVRRPNGLQDVPPVDGTDNLFIRDVVGPKTDTIFGDSLVSLAKLVNSGMLTCGTSPNTGGTANTSSRIELASTASAVDGAYDPGIVRIVAGTGIGQERQIWEYMGATRIAVLNRDWKVTPDDTSVYCVLTDSGNSHVNEGEAMAGGAATITLNTLASAQDQLYRGQMVFLVAGTGADQARMIVDYDGTTKIATVDSDWTVQPDATSVYAMEPWPGYVFGTPTADSAANILFRDVIGSRLDNHSTDTIAGRLHMLHDHAHKAQSVYPTLAAGVTVTGAAGAWTLGAFVEIVPASTITSDFDIHFIYIENASAADNYEIVLYEGAGDNEIGRIRAVEPSGASEVASHPVQTPLVVANSRIRCKVASASGGSDTVDILVGYHLY